MDLQEIYNALRSEYDGKTWGDEFLKIHVTLMRDGQVICWFDLDEDDEGFDEKRDSTISFYDEVVRFLVDRFGEEFKYEDPRISDDYIDRNNIHGQYEIVLDDDGENPAVIAIWENEETEMKTRFNESKKIVKEGAGAGYTVEIKDLKFGKIVDYEFEKDEDTYKVKVEITPGEYEIAAQDYYNDFFWQEHDFGETPTAQIDGGYAIFDIALDGNPDEDDEALFQMSRELQNRKLDISFDYGRGWVHADLPREGIEADHVDIDEKEVYFGIDKLVLNAPDLADAVNGGYQSTFDRDEDENEEPVDESTGAAKINLTWDEFNKLCDLIDMDWKRWNKNSAKSIPLVADRAVEHLEWIANKKLKGLDPKAVTISYTIPGSGIDEYDTGTQNTETIYDLVEVGQLPYNESYDSEWTVVGAGFDEFRQRLWRYTRKDMNSRRDAFSLCMNKCEEALKEYQDTVMAEDSTRMF